MYCKKCGKLVETKALFCPYCGYDFRDTIHNDGQYFIEGYENVSILWPIAGLICPFVIFIIIFYWLKDQKPKEIRQFTQGYLVGLVITVLLFILTRI